MRSKRDFQRQRIYNAEFDRDFIAFDKRFWKKADTLKFTKKVLRSAYWKKRYPTMGVDVVKITFRNCRGSMAYPQIEKIRFGTRYMSKSVVIHELTHLITNGDHHGEQFAKVYLELVKHYCGKACWKALKDAFKVHKVKVARNSKKIVRAYPSVSMQDFNVERVCPICKRTMILHKNYDKMQIICTCGMYEFRNGYTIKCTERWLEVNAINLYNLEVILHDVVKLIGWIRTQDEEDEIYWRPDYQKV